MLFIYTDEEEEVEEELDGENRMIICEGKFTIIINKCLTRQNFQNF